MNDCTAEGASCDRQGDCCYHPLWVGTQALVYSYLDSVTLDDVVHGTKAPAVDPKFADRSAFCTTFPAASAARTPSSAPGPAPARFQRSIRG